VKNYCNGELLDSYSYSYDNNGNITSVTTTAGTIFYQYDGLNQLTQETLLDGTVIDYQYDLAGNKTTKTVTQGGTPITTNYTYDAANQLTAVDGQAYTYDDNGNLISDGEKTYVYNEVNQLVEVKDASGTIAAFTYDFSGKRISKTTSSGTVNYHYAGDKVISETDASGNIITEYTWDQHNRPVSMIKDGATYYYHVNAHGDVTSLTDENGNVVAQYEYDAWGNILSQSGTMASINPYRYAGYMYDEETGLYYLMARYYDAEVGRFITRDTFAGFSSNPQSLNLYVYSYNIPVNLIDPSGHTPHMSLEKVNEWMRNFGKKFNSTIVIVPGKDIETIIRNDINSLASDPKTKQAFKNTGLAVLNVHGGIIVSSVTNKLFPSNDPEFAKALDYVSKAKMLSPSGIFDLKDAANNIRNFLNF